MLPVNYNNLAFADVTDLADFFKTKLPEINKVLMGACKLLFNLPQKNVLLQVSQEARVYKYLFLSPDVHKTVLGLVVYLPTERRLDIYDGSDGGALPTIQWVGKKVVWRNYPTLLDMAGFPRLFDKLINVI